MGYKFVCQKIGEIQHDFVLATKQAVDYYNWYNNEEIHKIVYVETLEELEELEKIGIENTIPVGTVEFVEGYYKKYFCIENIKPINIPKELLQYAQRNIWYGDETEVTKLTRETFCKNQDKVKGFTGVVTNKTKLPPGNYIFSEIIEIESEWRCFVYKGELVGIHNYINSISKYPDIEIIQEMVSEIKDLQAYTLDVGVNQKGTFVIEVHDFYSCGLYGFRDFSKLLLMMIESHKMKLRGLANGKTN